LLLIITLGPMPVILIANRDTDCGADKIAKEMEVAVDATYNLINHLIMKTRCRYIIGFIILFL
jgi:hypothetical protein